MLVSLLVQVLMRGLGIRPGSPDYEDLMELFEFYEAELYEERYIPEVQAALDSRRQRRQEVEVARRRAQELREQETTKKVERFDQD